ncbi:helix-turn-helix domain-containing protein [Kitasatospora sp. CM 4170]|uniref:GlxA family transcriptional regulator n=1 Tax=Kitasatospora aburaviensis TaxID=67265 RepID=A0ABW1F8Y5_9ACTN|nr:helix-turn-helix domain-containing protein [Kitasatospora sp. CM 4170]WNM49870.1 helix-turn-helix domain-containing protein [Kitasatospora sp. CM 4170]
MKAAVLVLDGAFDSGLSAVLDVLHSANALSGQLAGARPPRFDIRTVGVRRLVRTGLGHRVDTEGVAEAEDADILVVPALMERRPETLVDLVGSTAHRVARRVLAEARERRTPLATSCTGTFLLAESGVLDGLTATTSWWLAPVFRERYRRVTVDESRMVTTSDGVTTAGAAFGHLDLALAIVRMRSPALADLVRRYLVVDDRASQAAYTIPSALARHDPLVSAFEQWVRARIGEPLSIAEAARHLGVSERTLQRTVTRTLGCSPIRLVQDLRIEQAEHLLRTTPLPLAAVARRVGYESPGPLRTLLRDRRGLAPRDLRS